MGLHNIAFHLTLLEFIDILKHINANIGMAKE